MRARLAHELGDVAPERVVRMGLVGLVIAQRAVDARPIAVPGLHLAIPRLDVERVGGSAGRCAAPRPRSGGRSPSGRGSRCPGGTGTGCRASGWRDRRPERWRPRRAPSLRGTFCAGRRTRAQLSSRGSASRGGRLQLRRHEAAARQRAGCIRCGGRPALGDGNLLRFQWLVAEPAPAHALWHASCSIGGAI